VTEPDGLVIVNSIWKSVRFLLILTGIAVAISASCGALLVLGVYDLNSRSDGATACFTGLVAGGAITFGLIISVLATIWSAKATDRAFARLLAGEMLADWHFPSQEWERYVASEQARMSKGWWALWVLVGLPVMIGAAIPAFVLADSAVGRARNLILAAAVVGVLGAIAAFLRARFIRRRVEAIRHIPRVLIGRNAVYFGGMFRPWNIMTTVLRRVRIITGAPMLLDIVIGPGQSAQTALRFSRGALAVAAAFGGAGGAGISESSFISTLQVPVAAGREEEAARVVDALLYAPAPNAAPQVSASEVARPVVPGQHRWWKLTGILLIAGLATILLAPQSPQGTPDSPLYTAMAVTGMLLWVAAGVTALIAIVNLVRGLLGRRKAVRQTIGS
jgi:hypothetical protein